MHDSYQAACVLRNVAHDAIIDIEFAECLVQPVVVDLHIEFLIGCMAFEQLFSSLVAELPRLLALHQRWAHRAVTNPQVYPSS